MIILGAGGHGKIVAEIQMLSQGSDFTFIDDDLSKIQTMGKMVEHIFPEDHSLAAVIGIGNNRVRKSIARSHPYQYQTLIHPKTHISAFVQMGRGCVVVAGATINIDAKIGDHVIINTNASVGHDCVVDSYVHIAPNVALAGNVHIGEGTHVGIGSSVIQGVKIGKWCTIGAGTVVVRDVPDGAVVYGNPGRVARVYEDNVVYANLDKQWGLDDE